jgi:branched-chain amino acid transport system substrate-binding protein
MGEYMNQKGVKSAFLIGPNYAAGKDMLTGVRATFRSRIIGEELTKWPDQLTSRPSCRGARCQAKPCSCSIRALPACRFLTQYAQAGLKGQIPLIPRSRSTRSLPLQKDHLALGVPHAAVGQRSAQ